MSNEGSVPVVELKGVTKVFPGVRALDGVSLEVYEGEIHGLLGENGSGKSTLVKCLSGVHQPTDGTIRYNGDPVVVHDPRTARSLGVATIFQELSLVPGLTVAENTFLGRLPRWKASLPILGWKRMKAETSALLERLRIDLNPDALVADLSVAEQQMVEIAKALSQNANVVIMDEPSAAIGTEEIERLHELVRNMVGHGVAVIYISHRLDEIVGLVDRVTVLKDGRVAGRMNREQLSIPAIVSLMIGGNIAEHYPKEGNTTEELLLLVEGLETDAGVNGVSFDLHRGEVLGLAGLVGTGRTEIANAIFGIDSLKAGKVDLRTYGSRRRMRRGTTPSGAIKSGIALLTEDRKGTGLFMNFTGVPNISVARLDRISKRGVLDLSREAEAADDYVNKLHISPTATDRSVQFLSGGNQQKVIIARWLFSQAEVFILDEPTQGIDVGAKVEVYRLMNALTREGKGVIFISSDFEELLAMSDRVAIVNHGRIIDTRDARSIDRQRLMERAFVHQVAHRSVS